MDLIAGIAESVLRLWLRMKGCIQFAECQKDSIVFLPGPFRLHFIAVVNCSSASVSAIFCHVSGSFGMIRPGYNKP